MVDVPRGTAREKVCGDCRRVPAQPGQWRCRACHADYMRGWRARETQRIRAMKAELATLRAQKPEADR
jgi:hypothetical protein